MCCETSLPTEAKWLVVEWRAKRKSWEEGEGKKSGDRAKKREKSVSVEMPDDDAGKRRKRKETEKGESGEARAWMLRASPFCLNAVYAVARQQPLRSIHI